MRDSVALTKSRQVDWWKVVSVAILTRVIGVMFYRFSLQGGIFCCNGGFRKKMQQKALSFKIFIR